MGLKIIKIKTCEECPHIKQDDGGGHCSSFIKCSKFDIMLYDWDGPESFDYKNKIHPDCELEDNTEEEN